MIDIQSLGTGLKTKYDSSAGSTLRGLLGTNKLAMGQMPQSTAFPYIVFTLIDDIPMDTFISEQSVARVQFDIFVKLATTNIIGQIARELKLLYHGTTLTFPNHYGHTGTLFLNEYDLGIDSVYIHHVAVDFSVWTYKQTLHDATFEDLAELTFNDLAERTNESFALSVWK